MKFDQIIDLEYEFSSKSETELESTLAALEADVGGKRRPWGMRLGAIDLVTYLEFAITFVVGSTLGEALKIYFGKVSGLPEIAEKIGEDHNRIIKAWLHDVRESLNRVITSVRSRFHEGLRAPYFENMERPIAIHLSMDGFPCFVVLNGREVTDEALKHLPDALVEMLQYVAEVGVPDETTVAQLCLAPNSSEWRYLLVPSRESFGMFIDRVIDLQTGELLLIHSREEFIKLTGATKQDGIKFLVDPFRYQDR